MCVLAKAKRSQGSGAYEVVRDLGGGDAQPGLRVDHDEEILRGSLRSLTPYMPTLNYRSMTVL